MRAGVAASALAALALLTAAGSARAALTTDEIQSLCRQADGIAHCGRLIEEVQMKRLPNLARREGDTLVVKLYPTGETRLDDTFSLAGGTTFALFDYLNELNAVVLWTTVDNAGGFELLQRASGKRTALPSQPVAAPSGGRFATADFCPSSCENRLVVWQAGKDGVRRELSWRPPTSTWTDAEVRWKDPDTLVVEFTSEGSGTSTRIERRLADPSWTREAR